MAAHQAPPSLGFSRQEHWSGVAIAFSSAWKWKVKSEVSQSCPTLSNPIDCSPPGSSVHGIFQARLLEWGATAFSRGFSYMIPKQLDAKWKKQPWIQELWLHDPVKWWKHPNAFFFFFLSLLCSLWNFSSPTKYWTWSPSSESTESQSPGCQGIPKPLTLYWSILMSWRPGFYRKVENV